MKLLFDHNLSPRLVDRLADMYPNSQHLFLISLDQADDLTVWEYARQSGFTVVTRDADFNELSILRGFPPKVIWIRYGNCSTRQIEEILRSHVEDIQAFDFADAFRIFNLPILVYLDEREDYGEDRYLGIGLLDGRIVVVIYTEPDEEMVWIISLRKALSHERKRYEQYLKNRLG
jgi:predicted nuclease of predicted toxin-antitoxin system